MRFYGYFLLLLLWGGFGAQRAAALEVNYWPFFTAERGDDGLESWQALGPLVFSDPTPDEEVWGLRPLFVGFQEKEREASSFHVLYPLFNARYRPYGSSLDFLTLLRFQSFAPEGRKEEPSRSFHLFPVLFWGSDPDPEKSYFGIFPIVGTARNVLFHDQITWFLFPLAAKLESNEVTTTAMPWPFLRLVRGPSTRGFHLWPLYGQVATEGASSHWYWLWPLGYKVERELWKEVPFEAAGFLPFYSHSRSDRAISETYVWPFFGYTHSQDPEYLERRYFWPFLVQRRGDSYINRWAPFYTRSIRAGQDTRWILWPLLRDSSWEERGLLTERTQFLFFLYWSQVQSSIANPDLAPAIKQHVWPLYSYWDNGAGRRQFQTLSPFEVFFPFNDVVRAKYSPLFAFYRVDIEEGVRSRHSFLFDLITTERLVEEDVYRLTIGPLFGYERAPESRQWELLKGLISYSRQEDERSFGLLWFNRPEAGSAAGPAETANSGTLSNETGISPLRPSPNS